MSVAEGLGLLVGAIHIRDEARLGPIAFVPKLHQLVPVWLQGLAMASPGRQELDQNRFACSRFVPVLLSKFERLSAQAKNEPDHQPHNRHDDATPLQRLFLETIHWREVEPE